MEACFFKSAPHWNHGWHGCIRFPLQRSVEEELAAGGFFVWQQRRFAPIGILGVARLGGS